MINCTRLLLLSFSSVLLPIIASSQSVLAQSEDTAAMPIILDDDGSPDGMIAHPYILQNPKFEVEAITVVQGEAFPELYAQNTVQMLTRLNELGIPVAAGRDTPLQGNNTFPELWREDSNNFWGLDLPEAEQQPRSISAPELMIQTIKESPQPVTILATGPLTNVAEALRLDPSIADNIAAVHVMGGAVDVEGNLYESPTPIDNEVAEWNIWIDPLAAQEVLTASSELGFPLYLSPLDATNDIPFTAEDAAAWRETGTPESILAADLMEEFFLPVIGSEPSVWDLVAAINLSEPAFCEETPLHINVVTEAGNTQGQTVSVAGEPPNANVCFNPSFAALPYDSTEIFEVASVVPSQSTPESHSVFGLLAVGTLGSALSLRNRFRQ